MCYQESSWPVPFFGEPRARTLPCQGFFRAALNVMDDLEAAEEVQNPETREVLLRVLQHAIFTWILIEYYHSYSLLVLCLRAVQAVRVDVESGAPEPGVL